MEEVEYVVLRNGDRVKRKVYSAYTKEELTNVISCCDNFAHVFSLLRLNKYYHRYITKFVKENDVDISHFVKNKIRVNSIEKKFVKDSTILSGPAIKKYLLKNKLVKDECSVCKIPPIWNKMPLSFQVDHINGNHCDNRIENLRLICANCHTQTDTYTGRNLRQYEEQFCDCGKKLKRNQTTGKCVDCIAKEKHLCTICKVNPRSNSGFRSYCNSCKKIPIEHKSCKECGKEIKRQANNTDYHTKCYKGVKLEKKGDKITDFNGLMNYEKEDLDDV
jgi:hypothetical protein